MNGDGIFDFQFRDRYPNTAPGSTGVIWQAAVFTASINGIVSYAGPNIRYAYALNYGDFVGSFSPGIAESGNQAITLGSRYSYGSANVYYYGGFANAAVGVAPGTFAFAGFRFMAADGIHYGYIRLRVSPGVIDFDFAAYETTPGEPIGEPVPEPGTMALLAFGAVGVIGAIAKRRRD